MTVGIDFTLFFLLVVVVVVTATSTLWRRKRSRKQQRTQFYDEYLHAARKKETAERRAQLTDTVSIKKGTSIIYLEYIYIFDRINLMSYSPIGRVSIFDFFPSHSKIGASYPP